MNKKEANKNDSMKGSEGISNERSFNLRTAADQDQNFEFGNSDSQAINIGQFKGFGNPKEDLEVGDLMERSHKQDVFPSDKNKENDPTNDYNDKDKYLV